jgi:energy-coupling factor transport system ATP-binding protein
MSCRIVASNVHFHYTPDQPVLEGVSLEFGPGAAAIIGQNGAGKTTLMKLFNGLLKPVEGRVMVGDWSTKDYTTARIAKRVGLVFQNPDDQIFKSKVIDEVMFGPMNLGASVGLARSAAMSALREMALDHTAEGNPYDLSYAQRKQLCVASILAMDTDVVVFDEPTISQDVDGLQLMGRIIRNLAKSGKTVISIVHDMDFAAEYFSRIVVMASGKVVSDGPPQHVFCQEESLSAARVDAPAMVKLSRGVGLREPALTVNGFADAFWQEKCSP